MIRRACKWYCESPSVGTASTVPSAGNTPNVYIPANTAVPNKSQPSGAKLDRSLAPLRLPSGATRFLVRKNSAAKAESRTKTMTRSAVHRFHGIVKTPKRTVTIPMMPAPIGAANRRDCAQDNPSQPRRAAVPGTYNNATVRTTPGSASSHIVIY